MNTSSKLPPNHPDGAEEDIPGYDSLPALEAEDQVVSSEIILPPPSSPSPDSLVLPDLILGCATFGYNIYTTPTSVRSDLPLRIVRLALSSGITAFDTAPHYHPSEIVLGNCLRALKEEWPRDSYKLITKVGKYGPEGWMHSFERGSVRRCVERSLKRLGTNHLDVVCELFAQGEGNGVEGDELMSDLHDVEFRSSLPCPAGNHLRALQPAHASEYGLAPDQLSPQGEGDLEILGAIEELRLLQAEGKVLHVGIAGYPLPTLLRFAQLVLQTTGRPIDVVQTYAHQTLANHILSEGFLAAFEDAQVGTVTNAGPLAMGLLTKGGGPEWHPARKTDLFGVTREAVELCDKEGVAIEDVATDFGYKELRMRDGRKVPAVVGCKNLEEIHANLRSFKRANGEDGKREREVGERIVALMEERGVLNWSWNNP